MGRPRSEARPKPRRQVGPGDAAGHARLASCGLAETDPSRRNGPRALHGFVAEGLKGGLRYEPPPGDFFEADLRTEDGARQIFVPEGVRKRSDGGSMLQ